MVIFLFLLSAAAAVAYAFWTYARRELPVPGRAGLAALRAGALALIVLLLFDPRLPGARGGGPARWALVDGSASMAVGPSGATPWDSAVGRARALRAAGARVLRFGGDLAAPPLDSALAPPPAAARSRLVPALERAAEAGAREVDVLSDLRLEDPVEVRAALARLGLGARFEGFGRAPRNAGVAALELPADLAEGQPVLGQAELFASGVAPGDSLRLEVREEDRLVFSATVAPPSDGRTAAVPLRLPPPARASGAEPAAGGRASEKEVRYRARVTLAGDAFPPDDEAVAYAVLDPRQGALVAVSFAPDEEPRLLLPLLERVTGLPARGWLRAGDRFFPLVAGTERATPIGAEEMEARLREAQVVVLHGLDARAPAWARDEAARAQRAIVFAADPETAELVGERVGPARAGEWYVDPEPTPSPLTADLAELPLRSLPPLTQMLQGARADDGAAPLGARFRGTGVAQAPLVLRERDGRRVAVVLGQGWWRWALRPGPDAEVYARLWSGVAGWLLEGGPVQPQRLRPSERVVADGAPVEWRGAARGARLTVEPATGGPAVVDTALAPTPETVRTRPLPPGAYRWRAVSGADTARGRFDVTPATAELRHPRMDAPAQIPPPPGRTAGGAGSPLRASPIPYLLIVGLLCAEWVGRRRKGLR